MFTLDANIFLRDLDPTDPDHFVCNELFEALIEASVPIFAPTLLLAEVAATISRTRRDVIHARVAAMSLRDLSNLTLLPLDEAMALQAADLTADHRYAVPMPSTSQS